MPSECSDASPERDSEAGVGLERRTESARDLLSLTAEDREGLLVDDRAVIGDVIKACVVGRRTELRDDDLDFEWLHLVGEDLAEELGVEVGEASGVDVFSRVGEALGVRVSDSGDPQLIELVVLADARKS